MLYRSRGFFVGLTKKESWKLHMPRRANRHFSALFAAGLWAHVRSSRYGISYMVKVPFFAVLIGRGVGIYLQVVRLAPSAARRY